MEHKKIKLSKLVANNGQIEGVPKNPRQWTKEDVEKLKASIEETPELLEARGCIVYPYEDKFVVLGGNMRLTACKQLGHKEVDCVVLDAETSAEKLKEIVIKDNGSFGAWDFDMLDNEWDDLPLADWGIEMSKTVEEKLKDAKKAGDDVIAEIPFTEILGESHNYVVLYFDNEVDWLQAQSLFDIKPVRCLSTSRAGDNINSQKLGVGRVLKGADALNKIFDFSTTRNNEN